MEDTALIAEVKPQVARRRVGARIATAILVIGFVSIVAFLRDFKPEAAGFEQKGWALLAYHASRLGFALYITLLCYSAGYRALELMQTSPRGMFNSARATFIVCFFFGASLYGIAFTILGLAGLIGLATGLAFTIPVLLFSYHPIRALLPARGSHAGVSARWFSDTHASPSFLRVVILVAIATVLLFLLTRVIFIPNPDGNIWEHYLHYYRAVLASGSTLPNEVWHHFYNSKGGGLVFLANVLSDFFSVQLVSACFVVVAGLIILDLLLEHCGSPSWAVFGSILFFAYLFGDVYSGAMFRVHGALLGYASFALWGSVQLQKATEHRFTALMITLVVSLIYLGFYLPVATAIFPLAFLLFVLTNVMFHEKALVYPYLGLTCGVCAGTALAFVINWVLTGLPEVTPMRWFWAIADRAKVQEVFGTGGIEFFLAVNNDLMQTFDWSLRRVGTAMRYPLPKAFLYLSLAAIVVVLARRDVGPNGKSNRFLVQIAAFTIPLVVFAQLVPSPSVYRMALFSLVFMSLASVVLLKRLVDVCAEARLAHAASAIIIICGMIFAISGAGKGVRQQRPIILQYATGQMSLKDALQAMESMRERSPGTSIAAISDFRSKIGTNGRILSLVYDPYDPLYSYTLPDGGIVSEPTYALIRNPEKLLAERPEKVATYLRTRNIGHFTLNLQSRLFSTVAFTSLFDVREMPKYLSVAYENRDFFILTWRDGVHDKQLPEFLLTLLDLKRTAVLHYPFTDQLATLVITGDHHVVEDADGFRIARDDLRRDLDKVINAEALTLLVLESSKALFARILDASMRELDAVEPGKVLEVRGAAGGDLRIVEKVSEREVKIRLLRLFRDSVYKEYVAELGGELASLSRRCDERVPFARRYPTDAMCH
jgi:hypothetical protein